MRKEGMSISLAGFGVSPSIYKGRGLYQVHLVKADAIRPFIPKQLKLVETLGYTMGGFYLGNYEDSSFGAFDELVVIAGIVKSGASPPCAWNAKVLVSNDQVRDYALKELGVVSQVAKFSKKIKVMDEREGGFLNMNCLGSNIYKKMQQQHVTQIETDTTSSNFLIQTAAAGADDVNLDRLLLSPQIKLSLSSLSGLTEHIPHHLLQYTCQMETRVRVVGAAKVSEDEIDSTTNKRNCLSRIVVQSKPFVAFEFNSMKMMVDPPTMVYQR